MSEQEKLWLEKCSKNQEKYVIVVDNDAVFVEDMDNCDCVFEFQHYGREMVLDLLRHIGCNADPA